MSNESNNLTQFDNFTLDTEKKVLWYEDEAIELPLKAIELLSLLVENSGELVTKEQIFDTVWKDSFVEDSVLTQNIYRLRKLFKKHGIKDELIKNVPRRGYRFLGEVSELVEEEIVIERSIIEKNFVAEIEFEESNEIITRDISPEFETKQLPPVTSRTFSKVQIIALSGLILFLSFSVIGAGFWFWKMPGEESKNSGIKTDNLKLERLTTSGKVFMSAISRDRQHLAYILSDKNTYSIILKHLPTNSKTVVVEPKDYEIRSLNFSADGNYLYFITREDDLSESTIYQIPIYGGTKRLVVTGVRHYFSISPDGEKFAFFRYDPKKDVTHLVTCKTDGSEERIVATRQPPNFFQVWETMPAWSPDGKKFVLTGYGSEKEGVQGRKKRYLFEIDIATGQEKPVKHPDWANALQSFWLKDGSGLIVSVRENLDSFTQFWHLSYPDGEATRITNDTNHYNEFTLSFDTKSIITSNKSEHSNLYLVPLDEPAKAKKLTSQTLGHFGLWGLDWTTDGKSLVFIKSEGRNDGNLWKINVETEEVQQLTFKEKVSDFSPKITPDGKSVLFSSSRSGKRHIWQIDLDGKNLRQITDTSSGEDYPEISNDGNWLFYTKLNSEKSEIWKKSLNGGDAFKVLASAGSISKISPTEPGKMIAYYFDPNEKEKSPWKYVLFSHEAKNELRPLDFNPHNHSFTWKKDGTGVYFAKVAVNQNNLWFYSIENDKSEQITNFTDQKIVNLSLSPDGKTVALARGNTIGNILQISGY